MTADALDLPFTYVDTPEKLAEALPQWFSAGLLGVDIECSLTGNHHCVLALLQIATHDQVWLVDPLPLSDLMKPALQALKEIPWIVHDFSGDGIVFKRIYDVVPDSVLDTMLLSKALGYPLPGLKTMAKLKLGLNIPKEEQDSNWMMRPLRDTQLLYGARDAALMLPLLRALAIEAEERRNDPDVAQRLARLPVEMRGIFRRIHAYQPPRVDNLVEKIRALGLGQRAEEKAAALLELRHRWGNEGDVAAVMEMGMRWILARIQNPPTSREALERTIPNPRFRRRRLEALWEILAEEQITVHGEE
ncbi:MAG: hypothetical protein KGN80_00545 [Acidobacteriota bacterium]|nr:hypothetical protein [Acidobacteriota bacterium]